MKTVQGEGCTTAEGLIWGRKTFKVLKTKHFGGGGAVFRRGMSAAEKGIKQVVSTSPQPFFSWGLGVEGGS